MEILMKRFLLKSLVVVIPFFLILVFPVWVLIKANELLPLDKIVSGMIRTEDNKLFGFGYSDCDRVFKLRMTQKKRPDILALGTSRIMEFSGTWFSSQYSFYNAGRGILLLGEMREFLSKLDYSPKVLFICLDQFFFSQKWRESHKGARYDYEYLPSDIIFSNVGNVYRDAFLGKIIIDSLFDNTKYGINATVNNDGFRVDGSYFYGRVYKKAQKSANYRFADAARLIAEGGKGRWNYENIISNDAKNELEQLIRYCKVHDIRLIAYLPPFPPLIWNKMMSMGNNYLYMLNLYNELSPLFDNETCKLFAFNTGDDVNSPDNEFMDAVHGLEKTYLRLVIKMIERDNELSVYFKSKNELLELLTTYPDINVVN